MSSYFSRLTDIVTCNLSEILSEAGDPAAAISQVIDEMQEGLAGCERCVTRARRAAADLHDELEEYAQQAGQWMNKAKAAVTAGDDDAAREALLRKSEVEDLIAGLEREHGAAVATHESLKTTLRALEARISEARRRQRELEAGTSEARETSEVEEVSEIESTIEASRSQVIEDELAELRRTMGRK